jgi:predicted lipoprotein
MKNRILSFTVLVIILGFTMLSSCVKKKDNPEDLEPNVPSTNRQAMLKYLASDIIVPAYANFDAKLDIMITKSTAFTTSPTEPNLLEFRQAWTEAYIEWQKVELFDVGPAYNHVLRSYINIYPTSVQGITDNIASGIANLEVPAAYATQGFPAFDYLINGIASTDAEIVALYTSDGDAAKRIAYVQKLTTQMNAKFSQVYSEWTPQYVNQFANKSGIDMQSSLGLLVNGYVLNYERYIRSGKFGIPSGVMAGGLISPERVEAFYSQDLSIILAKTAHQASADFFNGISVLTGKKGLSFKTYLDGIRAIDMQTGIVLSAEVNKQFARITDRLNALSVSLYDDVNNDNQKVIDVYNAMQKLIRLLKVDMTSAMSITITYTDNDGD